MPRTLLVALVILFFTACTFRLRMGSGYKHDQHIARIEQALYPIFNIRGQENPKSLVAMMEEFGISGLSMAFVDNGKVTWTKCYGYANLKDSVKMTPDHILRAASLSKPLTAMAALHFVEEGLLELDGDINQKLKGWKLPENEFTKEHKVTLAQMIGHRSGIKNAVHDGIPAEQQLPTLEDMFSGKTAYAPAQVITVPGEKYKYSNMGYMVLSELLADVAAKEFETVMAETLLQPCRMTSSTFDQELSPSFRRRLATGYDENGKEVSFYKHPSWGAGALWTTPTDLGKFLAEIMSAYHNPDKKGKVISHETAVKVFEESGQKLGFNKRFGAGNFMFRNDGSIPGYNCTFMGSLSKNQAVVLMLNTGSERAYEFLNYLWRSVSMEYEWEYYAPEFYERREVAVTELQKYAGLYINSDDSIRVELREHQLFVEGEELVPIGMTSFIRPSIPMNYRFETDSTERVRGLYVRNYLGDFPLYMRQP